MKSELSWNFIGLAAICLAAGITLVAAPQVAGIATFIFCLTGWLVALCLHEFAHAAVAARFGDTSVEPRGYLTLDPIQYFHGASFLLPLIALVSGGIALPGGAVMIRTDLIRKPWQQSLVALAGPLATLMCALAVYGAAALVGLDEGSGDLAAALVLLTFFNLTAFVLNMLPLPGLDGFAALRPFLPRALTSLVPPQVGGAIQIIMLLLVFFQGYRIIMPATILVAHLAGMDLSAVPYAFGQFKFWN